MNPITIRNLPPDVARVIRQKSKNEGTSLNRTVINLIREKVTPVNKPPKRTRYRDLDGLAGSWTKEEAAAFDKDRAAQRKIDPELWK